MVTMEAHNATGLIEGLKKLIFLMEFSVMGGWGWGAGRGYPPYVKIINISAPKKKKNKIKLL